MLLKKHEADKRNAGTISSILLYTNINFKSINFTYFPLVRVQNIYVYLIGLIVLSNMSVSSYFHFCFYLGRMILQNPRLHTVKITAVKYKVKTKVNGHWQLWNESLSREIRYQFEAVNIFNRRWKIVEEDMADDRFLLHSIKSADDVGSEIALWVDIASIMKQKKSSRKKQCVWKRRIQFEEYSLVNKLLLFALIRDIRRSVKTEYGNKTITSTRLITTSYNKRARRFVRA